MDYLNIDSIVIVPNDIIRYICSYISDSGKIHFLSTNHQMNSLKKYSYIQ